MNFGIVPETLLERAALWLGLVPVPVVDLLCGPLKARILMAGVRLGVFEVHGSSKLSFDGEDEKIAAWFEKRPH